MPNQNLIHDLLKTEDIEGLIAAGAPDDEYDSEAREINETLSKLNKDDYSEESVRAIVALV